MRRAANIDGNQNEVVKALRSAGMTVAITSAVGKGYPDLTVGWRNMSFLLELKNGSKPPSAQALTADERAFRDAWAGHYAVVNSPEAAVTEVIRAWQATQPQASRIEPELAVRG